MTPFDDATQLKTARRLRTVLNEGGALVLGRHEDLRPGAPFSAWSAGHKIYRASPR
jgi:chemotaxis methyl-accepting protein methylase